MISHDLSLIKNIIEITADPSLTKKGEIIARGKRMKRVEFGDNAKFHVAAKVINQSSLIDRIIGYFGKKFRYYVEIEKGQSTLLNVNSIAKRLHLKKKDIYKAADDGTLATLLVAQSKRISPILAQYEQLVNQGNLSPEGSDLTPRVLIKAITVALTTKLDVAEHLIKVKVKKKFGFGSFKNRRFLVKKQGDGDQSLLYIAKKLGAGGFGKAFITRDLKIGKIQVFKQAKAKAQGAKADIENEFKLLKEIHAKGKVWGIQAEPSLQLEMTSYKSGYLGKKYDSDYATDIKKYKSYASEQKLSDLHQLLFGLKYLADHDILHGDLKPENVFVKTGRKGIKRVHIADLGGACQVDAKLPNIENSFLLGRGFTSWYAPKGDMNAANRFIIGRNKQSLIEVEKKRDVFAMGFLLYEALTGGKLPFKFDSSGYPILSTYNEIKDNSIPEEIIGLIKKMLMPDYKARPTAAEAFKRLDDYIAKKHPELHERLEKEIERHYPGSNH